MIFKMPKDLLSIRAATGSKDGYTIIDQDFGIKDLTGLFQLDLKVAKIKTPPGFYYRGP
jgi:hypothetical protein